MSKYIPVEAEKWAEMVQAMALAADLMVENKRLAAENERLRKAGDVLADIYCESIFREMTQSERSRIPSVSQWLAAKEGGRK